MKHIEKYIFPGLLLLFGLILTVFGMKDGQSAAFMIGGLALLFAGIISALMQAGIINKQVTMILGVLFLVGSLALSWMTYRSVQGKIERDLYVKHVRINVIQGLKDLRTAQEAFKANNGRYTSNGDTLMNFVRKGKLQLIKAEGQVPDTLNEKQAYELGLIKRDTSYVNALDSLFLSPYVQEGRRYDFSVDSLLIARYSKGKRFLMEAGIVSTSGRNVPVFKLTEPDPVLPDAPLIVGDIDRATSAGNWKDVE